MPRQKSVQVLPAYLSPDHLPTYPLLGGDWIFASPLKIGRPPHSYSGLWRELDRASEAAGLGHTGTHTFRHSYRIWIDALGTPIPHHHELYGDAAAADMREAHRKIVQMALRVEPTARRNS